MSGLAAAVGRRRRLPAPVAAAGIGIGGVGLDLPRPRVIEPAIRAFALLVVVERHVGDLGGRGHLGLAWLPTVRVRHTAKALRSVAHRIVAAQIRIVIGAPLIIIIGVAVGIVGPARTARADEHRGGERSAAVAMSVTMARGTSIRGSVVGIVVIRIVGAGTGQQHQARGHHRGARPELKCSFH